MSDLSFPNRTQDNATVSMFFKGHCKDRAGYIKITFSTTRVNNGAPSLFVPFLLPLLNGYFSLRVGVLYKASSAHEQAYLVQLLPYIITSHV